MTNRGDEQIKQKNILAQRYNNIDVVGCFRRLSWCCYIILAIDQSSTISNGLQMFLEVSSRISSDLSGHPVVIIIHFFP